MALSGAIAVGDLLESQANSLNQVRGSIGYASGSKIVGHALETGATGETILVDLNIQ